MSLETTLVEITGRLRQGRFSNERAISQGIVLRLLQELGWDTWDTGFWSMLTGSEKWKTQGTSHWEGPERTPVTSPMVYTATDNGDGATATAKYILTMHEPLETKNVNPDIYLISNVHVPPSASYVVSNAPSSSLTVGLTTSDSWMVGVGLEAMFPASIWKALSLGININASYTFSVSTTQSVTVSDVPPGYGTILEVFTVSIHHSGLLNQWDTAGFVGVQTYGIDVPDHAGMRAQYPYTYFGH